MERNLHANQRHESGTSVDIDTAQNVLPNPVEPVTEENPCQVEGNLNQQGTINNQLSPLNIILIYPLLILFDMCGAIPLRQRLPPKIVGGKITITINEEEYARGLNQFRTCLIGKLVVVKGDQPYMIKDLKAKLSGVWGITEDSWLITPMGKGNFTMNLKSDEVKSRVFARDTLYLKPGVFRILQWM